ncbi:MAG: hypothetical protein N2253_09290 [Bacteroidia bacterium]|nr:hypothetical protein [Bacteroidia bacterium]
MTLEKSYCAAAYRVGREAARELLRTNTPLSLSPDDWLRHHKRGAFKRLLVLYPISADFVGFQSTITPYAQNPLNRSIVQMARKTKLPIFYNYLIWRERVYINKLRKENIHFVEERSPFATLY